MSARNKGFYVADFEEVKAGKISDVYFVRTREVLTRKNIHKRVTAEFVVKHFPGHYPWAVFAGLEEVLALLEGLPITVKAIPEGTLFFENDPVMVIEGDYLDFGVYETAVLGLICQASGIATKAARDRLAAGERTLLSFGARRMHPSIAPMIERNAYIGGCDGVAVIGSAERIGIPPSGTVPHALMLLMGDTLKAMLAYDEVLDPKIPRIALIDTFQDEKFESIRIAEAMGDRLFGVRLDTPGSRRGNFAEIIKEVRWELDMRGFQHVKIFVSGGLDEDSIAALRPYVDGFGVGTSLSSATVLDYAMDIVCIEGEPIAKRGKLSGCKQYLRCEDCLRSVVLPEGQKPPERCECGGALQPALKTVIDQGKVVADRPSAKEIRAYVLEQLQRVPEIQEPE